MNKTIIININGIVFHIEEDAYEVLKAYMSEVKRHFAYSKDSEEIVTDIENRLAEMFNERLADQNKQVIVLADVEEIILQMGKVSDFETEDADSSESGGFRSGRVLYRDNDDKIIGGVCSGLGHYFDIETKWMRLIAVILFFTSIGLVAYLILWAVLPTALSRKDKIAMRGEPVNLQTFKKSFDEESETTSSTDRTYSDARNINSSDPILEIINFVGKALKIVIKLIGGFIIAVGGLALFGLIIALLFGLGFINSTEFQQFPLNVINYQYRAPIFLSAFLLLIIPLLALILFATRVLLNRKIVSRYGAFAMLILWLTGVVMGVYYGSKIAAEFREEARFEQSSDLKPYPALTLKLNPKLFFKQEDSLKYNIDSGEIQGRVIYGKDNIEREMQRFDLFIEKSEDGKLTLVKELSGRGRNFENALEAAQRISYEVQQKDSIIQFDKYLSLKGNGLYRAQTLDLHLKIPVNTRLIIDGHLDANLRNYNLWYCEPEDRHEDVSSEWIMTEDGLKCVDEELYNRKKEN
ncbi:MAG: PspC domain-containing protein [Sphingobacteriaceae bacterium]